MFDNALFVSSKKIKMVPRDLFFQKSRRTYVITIPGFFMSSELMLEDIIMD